MLLSAGMLSLSFAPLGQFYLAWVGLAPLLLVIGDARSIRRAFLWGWLGGTVFFLINLSFLLLVTVPGALLLPPYLALYWGLAAAAIRAARLLGGHQTRSDRAMSGFSTSADGRIATTDGRESASADGRGTSAGSSPSVFLCATGVAAIWVAGEWLRGTVFTGFPWLFVGYSQSPLLAVCQIADFAGVYGVSVLVVLVNALAAMTLLHRDRVRSLFRAWVTTAALVAATAAYGGWRLAQTAPLMPGPTVLVVQPNDRDFRNKEAIEKQRESVQFHLEQTAAALRQQPADLVVWSETTMPALNPEVRDELGQSPIGTLSDQTHRAIAAVARLNNTSLLVGGFYVDYTAGERGKRKPIGMRNSAFYYDRTGLQAARYDKIHLVPFGEFIPGRESYPWLYRFFMWVSPYTEDYNVSTGPADALTVFPLQARGADSRFVSPICFDDIDPALMSKMFRRADGGKPAKQADFIVNLTNDGWFRWSEQPQHLQHALFRSIENRAPTARAVNTGVSAFIDSCGRVEKTLPVGAIGTATHQLVLDRRVTLYTRFGDVFAYACITASAGIVVWSVVRRLALRRS